MNGGAWYFDCALDFTPSFETKLKKSREDVSEYGIEMLDLHGIENVNEKTKAKERRLEHDRKKALTVKEAEDKAEKKAKEAAEVTGEVHQEGQEEDGPPIARG